MEMVNGYVFLDLTKSNVYSKALKVLGTDKPVVIKDGSGSPYFVDSLTLDGTNVVITKGGKTITIANDNTITSVGDVLTIMENIVDSKGNKRFIEGDVNVATISGLTPIYSKWSLSGSHLMIVVTCAVDNGTLLSEKLADVEVPDFILNKIYPTILTTVYAKEVSYYNNSNQDNVQKANLGLDKRSDGLKIYFSPITMNADRTFRVQFDLLIDTD